MRFRREAVFALLALPTATLRISAVSNREHPKLWEMITLAIRVAARAFARIRSDRHGRT